MLDFNKLYIYRITHIDNIEHILQYGITHKNSAYCNQGYRTIGDDSLINRRDNKFLPNGQVLGDYVPFYFHYRMPMLFVLQKGFNQLPACSASEIVYCISSVQQVLAAQLPFLFTNGHALAGLSTIYESKEIERIAELLDFEAIKAHYWKSDEDLDLKRRKEAEFLVLGDMPLNSILGFAVYDQTSKAKIDSFHSGKHTIIKPTYYF